MSKPSIAKMSTLALASTALLLSACASKGPESKLPKLEPAQRAQIHKNLIKSWDTDRNGVATCDDVLQSRNALFDSLDKNNDGLLRKGEYRLAAFEDKSFVFIEFDTADTDVSGRIDRSEFTIIPNRSFQGIDRDANCILDEQEAVLAAFADRSRLGARGSEDKKKKRGREGGKIDDIDN
ncbi:hypothetical protein [Kordiimonas sp. SCSIO 12610]|uniref:hypothetical protein n=1 Tax=Kordiimonas sp. SCSIO 12610 TaxID=2829597 RepID=UPI00210DEBF7|nr:hypothetical protein [Kordiimonas sp. SCSIO 12610]UTW56458.1 hypothetical protein KFF44_06030 [Kordiimonas sp. SCSIO 12610]